MITFTAMYKIPVTKQSTGGIGIGAIAYISIVLATQLMILLCYYMGSFALAFLAQTMFDYSMVARHEEEWFRHKSYVRLFMLLAMYTMGNPRNYTAIGLFIPLLHGLYMYVDNKLKK